MVGSAVGTPLGEADGRCVGDTLGAPVGLALGAAVGASVLSQQLKNVMPSAAGQHLDPGSVNPTSMQRGWIVQSASVVGDADGAALGLADGACVGTNDGLALGACVGRDVLHSPNVHTSLAQSASTLQLRPTSHRAGHTRPPRTSNACRPIWT